MLFAAFRWPRYEYDRIPSRSIAILFIYLATYRRIPQIANERAAIPHRPPIRFKPPLHYFSWKYLRPTGPAKRAKGRLFIGLVLASIFLGMGTLAWNEFGRFSAYGIMEGRIVHVTAPFAGILETMHVRDGEYVTKGQLLASIESSELRMQIEKLQGELAIAKAAIDARRADLNLRQRENGLDLMRSQLDYFQLVAQFHAEKAKLLELDSNQEVFAQLSNSGAVSRLEADQNRIAGIEQHSKVETLQRAIRQLDQTFAAMASRDGISATQPNDSHPLDTKVLERMLQVELTKDRHYRASWRICKRSISEVKFAHRSQAVSLSMLIMQRNMSLQIRPCFASWNAVRWKLISI